jgi:hypothetical protein
MSWPYGDPPDPLVRTDAPTWRCPGGVCECHPVAETRKEHELSIVLLASDGARMPGARCRVHEGGRVVNEDKPNADGDGRLRVTLPRAPESLLIEWAPADTPDDPCYPYRALYFSDLRATFEETGRRRLANLGFWTERTLEDNVRAFQRRYGYPRETGNLADIDDELTLFHDQGCPPITHDPEPGTASLDDEHTSMFAPTASKAKGGSGGDKAPPPTPQPPVSPSPHQGSVKVPSPAVQVDLIVDWGRGSSGGQPSSSFWLQPTAVPVAIGVVDTQLDRWATDTPIPISVTRTSHTSVLATLPVGPVEIRVDFDLQVTIDGTTKTVLAFRQLFFLFADGKLSPMRFAFEDFTYEKAPAAAVVPGSTPAQGPQGKPPVRAAGTDVNKGFRHGMGMHPLCLSSADLLPPNPAKNGPGPKNAVPRRTKRLFINAEMVDATDLFWVLHAKADAERYLHPALGGRPEHLRVLAWTTGKLPMIWFAAVPDAALQKTETSAADIVFFRPPPGANSFTHKPDLKGFKDDRHHVSKDGKVSTLWMLARFLLSSQPMAALVTAVADPSIQTSFSDQIQRTVPRNTNGKIVPASPVPHISSFESSFRACGMERSVDRSGAPHVLFFPLASEHDGYPGAVRPGLKHIVESAILCLWTRCALALDIPASTISPNLDEPTPPKQQAPSVAKRQLWLGAHSAGNLSLAQALANNGADVDRALSFSATHFVGTIESVIAGLTAAATARKARGKTLDAFVVNAPDLTKTWLPPPGRHAYEGVATIRGVSMDVSLARKVLATGARVTFLPAFADQLTHYTIRPVISMVPILHNLVGAWKDAEIDDAAGRPHDWQFLFFHEYPMHGGDGPPSAPNPFFLQALGAPNPLNQTPTKLPP